MPVLAHDGLAFRYEQRGRGLPFVFQHGLGADVAQPLALCSPPDGIRLIAFDCRGHGETWPTPAAETIGLSQSADDLIALLDQLGLERVVVGGISMGAGIALNLGLRYRHRIRGLVLCRPAWLDVPLPPNLRLYPVVGNLIAQFGPERGLVRFIGSTAYRDLARTHPANADSLVSQFQDRRAATDVARLERIVNDVPNRDRSDWTAIDVPTLVLGNRQDYIHPFEHAVSLADAIPDAELREVTPKAVDASAHIEDSRAVIDDFLVRRVVRPR